MVLLKSKNQDWHRVEILAELKIIKLSLVEVSKKSGFARNTLNNIFAIAIEKPADITWPSRYTTRKLLR